MKSWESGGWGAGGEGSASLACQGSLGRSSQCPHLETPCELGCQTIKGSLWAEGLTVPCKFTSRCLILTVEIYVDLGPSAWILELLGSPFLCLSSYITFSLLGLFLLPCQTHHSSLINAQITLVSGVTSTQTHNQNPVPQRL